MGELVTRLAGAGAGVAVGAATNTVSGTLVGAGAPSLIMATARGVRKLYRARRRRRQEVVLAVAARIAGIGAEEVVRRLQDDPEREELLIRTLQEAQDAATLEKLLALSDSLARGCDESGDANVAWETLFVRVLGDLDLAHLQVLDLFTVAAEPGEPPVGSVPGDPREKAFNRSTVASQAPSEVLPVLDALLSTLERHGLLRSGIETSGMTFGIGPSSILWRITQFGRDFLDRMTLVRQTLQPPGHSGHGDDAR